MTASDECWLYSLSVTRRCTGWIRVHSIRQSDMRSCPGSSQLDRRRLRIRCVRFRHGCHYDHIVNLPSSWRSSRTYTETRSINRPAGGYTYIHSVYARCTSPLSRATLVSQHRTDYTCTGWPQKTGTYFLYALISSALTSSNIDRFSNYFTVWVRRIFVIIR